MQVKCPKCSEPIRSKNVADLAFHCSSCGYMHTRSSDGKPQEIQYEVSVFDLAKEEAVTAAGKPLQRVYMPVWQVTAFVNILSESVEGGMIMKLASMLSGGGKSGIVSVYVPAIDLDADKFKYIATLLTSSPPAYQAAQKFDANAERLPCTVPMAEAEELADFIVLSSEAEKPGVLQSISYEMKVQRIRLVYLAYLRVDGELRLAV